MQNRETFTSLDEIDLSIFELSKKKTTKEPLVYKSSLDDVNDIMTLAYNNIFNALEVRKAFIEALPRLISAMGMDYFLECMEMHTSKYYRRKANPDGWTDEELRKAIRIFHDFKTRIQVDPLDELKP